MSLRFCTLLVFIFGVSTGFCSTLASAALVLPDKPKARINDYANVLPKDALLRLEAKFTQFENKTSNQAVVAIFQSLEGEHVDDVASKLFEKWALGDKEKNNGVLLLLSIQEHAIRIEVGYGLEGELTDSLSGQIIRKDMVPFLRDNQFATAILVFERRLEEIFVTKTLKAPKKEPLGPLRAFGLIFFFMFVVPAIFKALSQTKRGRNLSSSGSSWTSSGFGGFGGGFGGGGFGGGSSGGFGGGGGGSSGGGGASGSW